MNNKAFFKEFTLSELKSIFQEGRFKIIVLLIILFISFVVIGIGRASQVYLKEKMQDPFIKFIDLTNPMIQSKYAKNKMTKDGLKDDLWCWPKTGDPQIISKWTVSEESCLSEGHLVATWAEKYHFQGPTEIKEESDYFGNSGWLGRKVLPEMFKISVVDTTDVFYKKLKNAPASDSLLYTNDINLPMNSFGCIVTKKLIDSLKISIDSRMRNCNQDPQYLEYWLPDKEIYIPIKIEGVVNKLRNKSDILISPYVYWGLQAKNYFNLTDSTYYLKYFVTNLSGFEKSPKWRQIKNMGFELDGTLSRVSSGIIKMTKKTMIDSTDLNYIKEFQSENKINMLRLYDLDNEYKIATKEILSVSEGDIEPDYLTVLLDSLDTAESFSNMIENIYKIETDNTVIENKKNFSFFDKLINILSKSLIFFSVLSIIFFMTNILLTHIENNKKSLGTLKAFGLPSSNIIFTYSLITLIIVSLCFIMSYGASILVGDIILDQYATLIKDSSGYFSKMKFTALSFSLNVSLFIILPTVIICYFIFSYLFNVTPGDLIYNRKK